MPAPLRRIVDVVQRPLVASPLSMFYDHLVNWEVLECGHEIREAGFDGRLEEAAPATAAVRAVPRGGVSSGDRGGRSGGGRLDSC